MPERDHEFATPAAPETFVEPPSQRMTNADFRKMMMTPRAGSGATTSLLSTPVLGAGHLPFASPSVRGEIKGVPKETSEKAEKRKKKKSYYAKLKREEDDKMAELAAKYRDRARERRDGGAPGAPVEGATADEAADEGENTARAGASNTSGYRAVAPDVKSSWDAAERRKRMIQESKFLGGDMEHTHLVKGLDFALLQKVRSEISTRETAEEMEMDEESILAEAKELRAKKEEKDKEREKENEEDKVMCRTLLAKNILRAAFKTDIPERNEFFFPGRMAYVIELEDEGETTNDIPTTTIRSKTDVAGNVAHQQATTLTTNDIVINKLTQILSYLRAGKQNKKKKKDKLGNVPSHLDNDPKAADPKVDDIPLYDDVGDYVPSLKRDDKRRDDRKRDRDRDRNRDRRDKDDDKSRKNYFDKDPREADEDLHKSGFSNQDKEMIKTLIKREEEKTKRAETKMGQMLTGKEPEGYAECYPGMSEMNDAIDDSDDEADYSKMDLGNKKGPVGRWDFDTAEEYADYMSKKEALPKAAFQYGVKMSEGRKTRGKVGKGNEKAKLDKEWNQISALLDKRKSGGGGGGSESKRPKM